MIQVYGIKNCGSVKKALTFFKKYELEYELQDFKTKKVSCDEISSWLSHVELKTLFNSKSATYRTLQLKDLHLDEAAQKEWLCKENLLIKRPVVEYNGKFIVGFNEDSYKGFFL